MRSEETQTYQNPDDGESISLSDLSNGGGNNESFTSSQNGDDLNPRTAPRRSVSFGVVTVRSYDRVVGDNPSVSSGPALDFSWNYKTHDDLSIDHYEQHRSANRRSTLELVVHRRERDNILRHDFGVSRPQIASCIRSINRCKGQRRQTLNNLKFQNVEEVWEKVKRRLLRCIGLKATTKKEINQLWKNAPKAMNKIQNKKMERSNASSFTPSFFDLSFSRSENDKPQKKAKMSKKRRNRKRSPIDPILDHSKHILRHNLDLDPEPTKEETTNATTSSSDANKNILPAQQNTKVQASDEFDLVHNQDQQDGPMKKGHENNMHAQQDETSAPLDSELEQEEQSLPSIPTCSDLSCSREKLNTCTYKDLQDIESYYKDEDSVNDKTLSTVSEDFASISLSISSKGMSVFSKTTKSLGSASPVSKPKFCRIVAVEDGDGEKNAEVSAN